MKDFVNEDQANNRTSIPSNEETVIRSTVSGKDSGGPDIRLQYLEKIRNLELNYEKYQVREKIAEGGMGSIHQVFDKNLHRSSVLKVILPQIQEDPRLFQQFIKEAQITARLEHPNIIPVHDIGIIDGDKLHFVMKEVQGDSLADILRELKAGTEEYTRRYTNYAMLIVFRKICDAVAFAHSRGVLHRDIKPENIMVGEFGEVLLMDWGLAKHINEDDPPFTDGIDFSFSGKLGSESTLNGVVKGSPAFMSPEQANGKIDEIDERSDIFLLGSTLYSIATLNAPYSGADIEETLANAQQANLIAPELRNPERKPDSELCRIIQKAMAADPAQRYESVIELIEDIDFLLEGNTSSITRTFEAGEVIIQEGDVGEDAYVINSGSVEVCKSSESGDIRLIVLGAGNVIGEMALISKSVRSATIRALEKTELVIITKDVMEQGLSQLPSWLGTVVDCLTQRLVNVNQQVHPLLAGDCTYHVLRHIQYCYFHLSEERQGEPGSKPLLVANLRAVIREVSNGLCIPEKPVDLIVSQLLTHTLLKSTGEEEFRIANFDLFDRLVNLSAEELSIEIPGSLLLAKFREKYQSDSTSHLLGCDEKSDIERKLVTFLEDTRKIIATECS